MLQLINPNRYGEFIDDLAEMHRLRYRIFKERLRWDVQVSGDMEVDEFDACQPVYLLQRNDDDRVQGCVRLLSTTGPPPFPSLPTQPQNMWYRLGSVGPSRAGRR